MPKISINPDAVTNLNGATTIDNGNVTLDNLENRYIARTPFITAINRETYNTGSGFRYRMTEISRIGNTFQVNSNGDIEVMDDTCSYIMISGSTVGYTNGEQAAAAWIYKRNSSGTVTTITRSIGYGTYQHISFPPKIIPVSKGDTFYLSNQNGTTYVDSNAIYLTIIGIA